MALLIIWVVYTLKIRNPSFYATLFKAISHDGVSISLYLLNTKNICELNSQKQKDIIDHETLNFFKTVS